MSNQSITNYVDVSVDLEGTPPLAAGFGTPMFLHEHAIGTDRLAGPFSSVQAVLDAGHLAGSPPALYAAAHVAQQPRASQFYIGQARPSDADVGASLLAVTASNPGAWYCALTERRDDASILAFAAAMESLGYPKLGIVQSGAPSLVAGTGREYEATVGGTEADGPYNLIFTGYGLVSPVTVTVTRAGGSPATNLLLATALEAELEVQADVAGDVEDVVVFGSVIADGTTISFRIADGLAAGTVTSSAPVGATLDVVQVDADVATTMQSLGYVRTAGIYHPADGEYLDAGWASRCLSFDLDKRKGAWSYKTVRSVAGTSLTDAQASALRQANWNYFSPAVSSAGQPVGAFTAQGRLPGGNPGQGRPIDVTTTLDWGKARQEEALLGVLLRETHTVGFDDAGINRFTTKIREHYNRGIAAGHYLPFIVPEGEDYEGLDTPAIFAPSVATTTITERAARELSFSSLAYLKASIERVVYRAEIRQ